MEVYDNVAFPKHGHHYLAFLLGYPCCLCRGILLDDWGSVSKQENGWENIFLSRPDGIIRVWEAMWRLSLRIQTWTTQLSLRESKEQERRTNRICILCYPDIFHLESISFAALIQLFVLQSWFFLLLFYLGQILPGRQIVRLVPVPCVLEGMWVGQAVFL